MNKKILDKKFIFWELLYNMHLYETNGEGLFKAIIITFSWIGGVHLMSIPDVIDSPFASSLFLFSIALIMEYVIRLVCSAKKATRILPFLIVIISLGVAFIVFGYLMGHPFDIKPVALYYAAGAPQFIIWLDITINLLLGKPDIKEIAIENHLKNK